MYKTLIFLFCLFVLNKTVAQVSITTEVTPEMTVCGNSGLFSIKVINQKNVIATGVAVSYELPIGVNYQPGSVTDISGTTVESNISNLMHPVFTANDIPAGDSVCFQIHLKVSTPSVFEQQSGTIFRNTVHYSDMTDTTAQLTAAYNILFASLNITVITPVAQTVNSGEQTTRTISIVNAGYGTIDHLIVSDLMNSSGLTIDSVSHGTLSGNGDTISLSGIDFTDIGNGNQSFDFGETVMITEFISLSGCSQTTVSSVIKAHWGCEGQQISTVGSNAHITIDQQMPKLIVATTNWVSTCSDSASQGRITIENKGQGIASGTQISIFKSSGDGYDETIFSRIDSSSFTYSLNGGQKISFMPHITISQNSGVYVCLGNIPVGKVDFTLPMDLSPDDLVEIDWAYYKCCIDQCLDQGNMGWECTVNYQNYCQNNNFSTAETGEDKTRLNAYIFTESPSDIDDGEKLPFTYRISSWENNLPQGDGANYTVKFTLPDGLIWSGDANDISWKENNAQWVPDLIDYNTGNGTVTARFLLPETINMVKSELKIWLTGNCDNGLNTGEQNIELDIVFIADTTCSAICEVNMICEEVTDIYLHCPVATCEGVIFYQYDLLRSSTGKPDNNLDGIADINGSLDLSKIKLNRSMFGDTLIGKFEGIVKSTTNQSFNHLFAESAIEQGQLLTPQSAFVEVYDASSGQTLVCDQVAISYYDNGNQRIFRYRVITDSLLVAGCGDFAEFHFEDGDSVFLSTHYKITTNFGPQIEEIDIDNQYFLCQQVNPWSTAATRYYCDIQRGRHTFIGYELVNTGKNTYNVKTCDKTVQQSFKLTIGDCCNNFEGGNLFPYEYRYWAKVSKVTAVIPNYYTVNNAYFKQKRTRATNVSATQISGTLNQSNTSPVTLEYDLDSLYTPNGGTIIPSDDGFTSTFYLNLSPSCDVAINTLEDIIWTCQFEQSEFLGGGLSNWIYPQNNDRIKYNPTDLMMSSSKPVQDGESRTVTWPLTITNTTGNTDAGNSWLHVKSPGGTMALTAVTDASGDTLVMVGDIFKIGTINRNSSKTFYLTATYSACHPDYIVVYNGYECSGYPDYFTNFQCSYSTFPLHVEPKPAAMQARIAGSTIGGSCNSTVEVSVELASVKFGHLDSIRVVVTPSDSSFEYLPGSSGISYPVASGYLPVTDPQISNGNLIFFIEDYASDINKYGLPGVHNLLENRLKLKFQMSIEDTYLPGDHIAVSFNSREICGADLPVINLAYDPSVTFSAALNTGLNTINTDAWGVAWVDYDGDGFDDCFVSNYNSSEGNTLYRNNGNGTFSSVNAGPLTETPMNTVSSTWGDYDNDGDIDVFLANNVGASNMLFTNNGDGTFSFDTALEPNTYGGYCHNATWVDYNNDGYLDLFVTDYMETKQNLLYQNKGDGTFERIQNSNLVLTASKSIGTTWSDYDNDGDMDAFVPNTNGINNALYRNEGNGIFTTITTGSIVNDGGNSVGCSWGDFDNNGYMDLFVANTGGEPNFLYINNGDGSFSASGLEHITTDRHHSSGSSWIDLDNDGDLDLYVTSDLGDSSILYLNNGDATFSKPNTPLSDILGNSYPNAWSDYDNDGDLDLIVGNRNNEKEQVFENTRGNCNNYLCFNLIGTTSNASAIGARIKVLADIQGISTWQVKEISAQTGGGAGSQNSLKVIFGMHEASLADSVIIEWPSGQKQYFGQWAVGGCNTVTEPIGNLISGTVFEDMNQNCQLDSGEAILPHRLVKILPGPRYTTTDLNGNYSTYLEDGAYDLIIQTDANWTTSCTTSHSIILTNDDTSGLDFGLISSCQLPDLTVRSGSTALRRGFKNQIVIQYENQTALKASAVDLSLEIPEEIVPISSSIPWTSTELKDSTVLYIWQLDTVTAFEQGVITVIDSVDLYADLGKTLLIKTAITTVEGDCAIQDNTALESGTIVGSVDPNDKLVSPSVPDGIAKVSHHDRLHYKIRFQNVGNYYASRVIIMDTLSPYLDINTIQFEGNSHDFEYRIEGRTITWFINDIYLPDSTENPILSQGFVKFSILPMAGLPHHTIITNTACIQFDYNDYIYTNTVSNKVVDYHKLSINELSLNIYPNPADVQVTFSLTTADKMIEIPIQKVILKNSVGKIVMKDQFFSSDQSYLEIGHLGSGFYYLEVLDISNRVITGKLIIQH